MIYKPGLFLVTASGSWVEQILLLLFCCELLALLLFGGGLFVACLLVCGGCVSELLTVCIGLLLVCGGCVGELLALTVCIGLLLVCGTLELLQVGLGGKLPGKNLPKENKSRKQIIFNKTEINQSKQIYLYTFINI